MDQRVLVCYATGAGSTAEVAAAIGEELHADNADNVVVDVSPCAEVTSLESYSAVVVGSSVRLGRWLPDAVDFLDRFGDALAERPVAYFMTCLMVAESSEDAEHLALSYWMPVLTRRPDIEPVGLGLFAGSLAPEMARLPAFRGGPYGDYRDWDAIRSWARQMRPDLLKGKPRATKPLALSGTILSYSDLSGLDLTHFDLQNSKLIEARLRDASLRQADLRRAQLTGADLRGADLEEAQLGWADLHRAQCGSANFAHANLIGANLDESDLQDANLRDAILNGASVSRARLQRANLQRADLNWADLRNSDLSDANLQGAKLGWANLLDAKLTGANLSGARYTSQTKWPTGFSPEEAGCVLVDAV